MIYTSNHHQKVQKPFEVEKWTSFMAPCVFGRSQNTLNSCITLLIGYLDNEFHENKIDYNDHLLSTSWTRKAIDQPTTIQSITTL
jgi:hypothetical protein